MIYGFTYVHLNHCGHHFYVVLFIVMLQHGYKVKDYILLSIISISKAMKSHSSGINYRGISLFHAMGKVFDYAVLAISKHNMSFHRTCNLVLSNNTSCNV